MQKESEGVGSGELVGRIMLANRTRPLENWVALNSEGCLLLLQVSDAENILGIIQIENIQIIAEAYDVALDISFPKGGCLLPRPEGSSCALQAVGQLLSLRVGTHYEASGRLSAPTIAPRQRHHTPVLCKLSHFRSICYRDT